MKGGVTSGVVYPSAIQEIAKKFHFVGIGGTSAGAIAAAVTAAAEYRRRQTGSVKGFDMLRMVSDEMSDPERLLALFQPDKPTRHYIDLARPFLGDEPGKWAKVVLVLKLACKLRSKNSRKRFLAPLITNNFGACSGMANDNIGSQSALTVWLSELINQVSGLDTGQHLTFKDLHGAKTPPELEHLFGPTSRSIDFRAVTTCLSFNRPFEFPLREHELAFDINEWKEYFPKSVMMQLIKATEGIDADQLRRDGKLPLPNMNLPIIVAARMSLSFPLLFSAVPLWATNQNKGGNPLERVFFSDGGITSNFPVHRFDSIYPRWPTLAINFKGTDETGTPLRKSLIENGEFVYMNKNREEGVVDIWSTISKVDNPQGSLFSFLFSIFRSAQNWHDNSFLRLPGFRDRVAEIWLGKDEGGLNLAMPETTIRNLVDLGHQAGAQLAFRYGELDQGDAMSWQGHKWTRFRSGMEGLAKEIEKFKKSVGDDGIGQSDLGGFFSELDAPPCYLFENDVRRVAAIRVTDKLYELAQELQNLKALDDKDVFGDGPLPPTDFGSRAPI